MWYNAEDLPNRSYGGSISFKFSVYTYEMKEIHVKVKDTFQSGS